MVSKGTMVIDIERSFVNPLVHSNLNWFLHLPVLQLQFVFLCGTIRESLPFYYDR